MISVNRKNCIFLILGFAIFGFSACANIPKDPTATPTLSDEEKLEFFKQTAAVEAAIFLVAFTLKVFEGAVKEVVFLLTTILAFPIEDL